MMGKVIGAAIALTCTTVAGIAMHKKATAYDEEGYNRKGYDREGYNREGYNKHGFDREGYDSEGYDIEGYNSSGYNREGFNIQGYDSEGYDKNGFNHQGYNRKGFDKHGYDTYGYDSRGKDRGNRTKSYYTKEINEINEYLNKAKKQLKNKEYEYATHDIRISMEIGVKCVIVHSTGDTTNDKSLDKLISFCKYNDLLPQKMIAKLFKSKNICNRGQHNNQIDYTFNRDELQFCLNTVEELVKIINRFT